MSERRPPAVLLTAAWQLLLALIWLARGFDIDSVLLRLALGYMAVLHLRAAYGLYSLSEWGRQGALQLVAFDLLGILHGLLGGHLSPLGALFQAGMPLFTLTALTDSDTRQVFS